MGLIRVLANFISCLFVSISICLISSTQYPQICSEEPQVLNIWFISLKPLRSDNSISKISRMMGVIFILYILIRSLSKTVVEIGFKKVTKP